MAHDPDDASAEFQGDDVDSSPGDSPRAATEQVLDAARAASQRAASEGDRATSLSAGAAAPRHRSPLPIVASHESLHIGDVDVTAVRSVLTEIGADGSTSLDRFSPTETIALLARLQELSGAIAAVQARGLVQLEKSVKDDSVRRGDTPRDALKVARSEASKALKQSKSCAGQSMSSGRRLVGSMPGMLTALAHGRVVPTAAHKVGSTMGAATPEQRSQVDEILTAHLPHLEDCGPEELAGEAAKVLHGLDPRGAAGRHRVAKRERHVTVRRSEHGMCTLTAHLTALDGARIRRGLSIAAEKARAHGDRRGHQQIMADLFADALIGRGDGVDPSTLEIGLIITDRSLLAPDHADAAIIEGYGPVPFEHVREEMLRAAQPEVDDPELTMTLRRLYLDADDGQLTAADSRSRHFPPALARFLRLGHQTCRAPYCDASIRQNDHIVPWSEGGATSLSNGNGACVVDNQKEESGETARVITDENGTRRTVEWTSRYGQKARRRGINFDPLGTGRRLLARAAEESSPRETPDTESSATSEPPITQTSNSGPPTAGTSGAEIPISETSDTARPENSHDGDPHASFLRALDRVERRAPGLTDPHPAFRNTRRDRHWLLQGRHDYVFESHLTVITDRPYRGT
jgi:hypothetical protein